MRSRKFRGAMASAAALLVVLTACGTDDSLDDDPPAAGETEGGDEQEWFVQEDFDTQDAQRDATFEGDPEQPWLQYIDGELSDTAEFKASGAKKVCFANA